MNQQMNEQIAEKLIDNCETEPYWGRDQLVQGIAEALAAKDAEMNALKDYIHEINEALGVTQNTPLVTGNNALDAINDPKATIQSLTEEVEHCKKVIEERGYAFQEAQNKTLLKNADLQAQLQEAVRVMELDDKIANFDCPHYAEQLCQCVKVMNGMWAEYEQLRKSFLSKIRGEK